MSYTIMPGDPAPNFHNLLATDSKEYSLEDLKLRNLTVLFFSCIIALM